MSDPTPGVLIRRLLAELGFEAATILPNSCDAATPMDVSEGTRTKIEPFLAGQKKLVIHDDGGYEIT